ncbi:MAG TPA: VWA domain-containing protein [Pyrinomonadaceae bacterium]|jgi:VWFA-related protein|nr:VWA domain-containing protein [Pyrinomonadaceae bacterium]
MFYRKQVARFFAFTLAALLTLSGAAWPTPGRAQQPAQDAASSQPPAATTTTSRPRRAAETTDTTSQQQQPAPARQTPRRDDDEITIQDDEVERVETDLTNVLFTAIDKNKRFITTLKQEDIRITEDGIEQQVFTFQRETDRPLSLAILIDTSASQERTLPEEKAAARSFVDAVIRPAKDEVAVVSFTGEPTLEQGLTGNAARVRSAIDRVEFTPPSGYMGGGVTVPGTPPISGTNQTLAGSTAIWNAVWVASKEILSDTSDKTRRAIILLTDGIDTSSTLKMSEAIDRAVKADAVIYTIGIGDTFNFDGVDEGSLRKLSERTGGRAYFPRDETDLRNAFLQIQQELRSQYLVAYSSSNKKKDGSFRKVSIDVVNPELRKQNLRLTYRQGYFAKTANATTARQ